jgi:hypothetical protein
LELNCSRGSGRWKSAVFFSESVGLRQPLYGSIPNIILSARRDMIADGLERKKQYAHYLSEIRWFRFKNNLDQFGRHNAD